MIVTASLKALLGAFFMENMEKMMAESKDEYLAKFKKWGFLGGRPRAFKSPRDMAEQMAAFLEKSQARIVERITKSGLVTANIPAPTTIEAFCDFCGVTKTTFYEYAKKPEFKPLTDYYSTKVEKYWVDQCAEGQPGNKADFILKNAFGDNWKEKSDVKLSGGIELRKTLIEFEGENSGDSTCEDTGAV